MWLFCQLRSLPEGQSTEGRHTELASSSSLRSPRSVKCQALGQLWGQVGDILDLSCHYGGHWPCVVWVSRICHLNICHFGIRMILNQKQLSSSRYKKSSLPFPVCLKAGHKFIRCPFFPSLPGRTNVNCQKQL